MLPWIVGSLQTDGRIKSLEMHGIQKRYSPEKHYVSFAHISYVFQRKTWL